MTIQFKKGVRKQIKIRASVAGPSGSGKTVGALRLAYGMTGDWEKIFVIDTNIDDALCYINDKTLGIGEFMHAPLPKPHSPERFVSMINAAINEGAEVVIIDSASDEWAGTGGMLEIHDAMPGNGAANWGKVNPRHMEFIKSMVEQDKVHIIATFRQKSKVALNEGEENGRKKTEVVRLGMENIARPGTEYDFLLAVELQRESHMADVITKRGSMLPDMRPVELTVELGQRLRAWADAGEIGVRIDNPEKAATESAPSPAHMDLTQLYPKDFAPKVSLETASKAANSNKQLYTSFDDRVLIDLKAKVQETLRRNGLAENTKEDLQLKVDSIDAILYSRAYPAN